MKNFYRWEFFIELTLTKTLRQENDWQKNNFSNPDAKISARQWFLLL